MIRLRLLASMILILTMVVGSTVAVVGADAEATACVTEVEPNDVIADAVTVTGEQCVSGTLLEVGDTDVFVWRVTEAEATRDWTVTLAGDADVVTTVDVVDADGVAGSRIASVQREPGSEAATSDISVEAGTYALIVGGADPAAGTEPGARDYELRLALAADSDAAGPADAPSETARIVVVAEDGAAPTVGGGVAVEMLLDTSGSMRKRLGAITKIVAAKRSLVRLVDVLPEGLPVALRTFTGKPGACATALRVPLEPLQPAAMKRAIRRAPARKGVKTPIAKAVSKVPRDLRDAEGHRLVVLVTDGKEDCGGDPAAAITALSDAADTTVHIIGYALEDGDVASTLAEWATLGGGRYLDAPDRTGLEAALDVAFTAPYLVFDEDGALVAQGLAGDDGVEIEAGVYRVEVLTDPPTIFEALEVDAGATRELPLASSESVAG